jgi:hypothetical protein
LDAEYHIEGTESQAIAIQLELFIGDGQSHVPIAPQAVDTVTIGNCDVKARATTKMNASTCTGFKIQEIVGRSRIKKGRELCTVDEDEQLHCPTGARAYASEGMNGDGWISSIRRCLPSVLVIHHLDGEQLLAHQLVPVRKKIITVKALPVFVALGDLHRREVMGVGCRLCDR